jgi:DNA-binding FadR family transcriptional regulator
LTIDKPKRTGGWLQIRAQSASGEIVAQIRSRLFSGALVPGDFLGSERELSREFGVSRVTMRDALRILEANGIIEVKVGKSGGVRVSHPNVDRIAESLAIQLKLSGIELGTIFEAQIGIQGQAARLAAIKATDEELALIEATVEALASGTFEPAEFVNRSQDLHVAVTRSSHNEALTSMYQALSHLARPYMFGGTTKFRMRRVIQYHRDVLSALRARNPEAVVAVVLSHLQLLIDTHLPSRAKSLGTSRPHGSTKDRLSKAAGARAQRSR